MVDNLFNIQGKHIVMTGGTGEIGRELVKDFVEAGAKISVIGSNEERLQALKEQFSNIKCYRCDLRNEDEVVVCVNEIIKTSARVDILINNAGINADGNIEEVEMDQFENIFKVNMFAPFLITKYILPIMKKQGSGNILNMTSTLGTRAVPNVAAYAASKAALIHFTKCLSIEVAPFNIRANCISPGYCKSNLNREFFESEDGEKFVKARVPMQRLLEPKELVALVRLAISDAGSYITGANIIADGGIGNW